MARSAPRLRHAPPRAAKERREPAPVPRHGRVTRRNSGRMQQSELSDDDESDSHSSTSSSHNDDLPSIGAKRRRGRPAAVAPRSKRARVDISYEEDNSENGFPDNSEDDDLKEDADQSSDDELHREQPLVAPSRPGRPRRVKPKKMPDPEDLFRPINPVAISSSGDNTSSRQTRSSQKFEGSSDGDVAAKQPSGPQSPWAGLPYMILVDIFTFAAGALDNPVQVSWLVAASRTCSTFAEPALTALYKSPPHLSSAMAIKLAWLLDKDPSKTMYNYRQKIEVLHINVALLPCTYKKAHLETPSMIARCPRLVDLAYHHKYEEAPYHHITERIRWSYPPYLFETLAGDESEPSSGPADDEERRGPIRLRSWRWSARMMGNDMSLDKIKSIHVAPSFVSLKKIAFDNYQRPSLNIKNTTDADIIDMDKRQAETFAEIMHALPSLTHLIFESCSAANEHLLPLLPFNLDHLELQNCWNVGADALVSYLSSRGRDLRHLTLHHNHALNLAFLPLLGSCCPNLESLRMDMMYHKLTQYHVDPKPHYDELLLADQVPAWPRTMQVVELENLRKWSPEAAETFFQSFISSAPGLPALRRLSIKAMLDIPWRQRSAIRDTWVSRLRKCFLRRTSPPNRWRSIADVPQQRVIEANARKAEKKEKLKLKMATGGDKPSRRSGRTHSSSRASSVSRELRRGGGRRGQVSYREPDSSEDDWDEVEELPTTPSKGGDDGKGDESGSLSPDSPGSNNPFFIQGLCDVVDIRFDNQKPTERQYGMEDFLDSDDGADNDDDWSGDRDGEVDYYAW